MPRWTLWLQDSKCWGCDWVLAPRFSFWNHATFRSACKRTQFYCHWQTEKFLRTTSLVKVLLAGSETDIKSSDWHPILVQHEQQYVIIRLWCIIPIVFMLLSCILDVSLLTWVACIFYELIIQHLSLPSVFLSLCGLNIK